MLLDIEAINWYLTIFFIFLWIPFATNIALSTMSILIENSDQLSTSISGSKQECHSHSIINIQPLVSFIHWVPD
jgi:hypothetical protein